MRQTFAMTNSIDVGHQQQQQQHQQQVMSASPIQQHPHGHLHHQQHLQQSHPGHLQTHLGHQQHLNPNLNLDQTNQQQQQQQMHLNFNHSLGQQQHHLVQAGQHLQQQQQPQQHLHQSHLNHLQQQPIGAGHLLTNHSSKTNNNNNNNMQQVSNNQQQQQQQQQQANLATTTAASSSSPAANSQAIKKELPANGKKTKGRVRIKMEFIHNKLRRYTTFSKRKTGIMKKAFELATLTGTQVMLLVASETGHVYTFATRKLQPMIISDAGKALIQTCLNSPDSDNLLMSAGGSGGGGGGGAAPASAPTDPNGAKQSTGNHQLSPPSSSPSSNSSSSSASTSSSSSSSSSLSTCNGSPTTTTGGQASANQQHLMQPELTSGQPGRSPGQQHQLTGQQLRLAPANEQQLHSEGQFGSQQQQSTVNNSNSNLSTIQSQHNMMLAAAAAAPKPTSSTSTPATSASANANSNTPTNAASMTTNQNQRNQAAANANNSTTDQRMSAQGFEETDLSYSINDDDLSERPFGDYLPISLGTIHSSGASNPNIANVNNQLAFERTLESQQASFQGLNRGPSGQRPSQTMNGPAGKRPAKRSKQQFNYNPLYAGIQQQAAADFLAADHNEQEEADEEAEEEDDEEEEEEDEEEDDDNYVFNDIYRYTAEALQQTDQQQQQQQKDCAFSYNQNNSYNHARNNQNQYNYNNSQRQQQQNQLQHQHQRANGSYQQQQLATSHQFVGPAMGATGNQLDLADECLFVEYQTSRLNSLGGLEQLHTLNVTNCDSETLEEQINMLEATTTTTTTTTTTGTNTTATDDDQDDHEDGQFHSGNQDFLNLLFSGSGHADQLTLGDQQVAFDEPPVVHLPTSSSSAAVVPLASGNKKNQSRKKTNAGKANNNNKSTSAKGKKIVGDEKGQKTASGKQSTGELRPVTSQTSKQQQKITTTNTNRRLLPKSRNNANQQQQQHPSSSGGGQSKGQAKGQASSSWLSSSSSPSSSSSSSSSSSYTTASSSASASSTSGPNNTVGMSPTGSQQPPVALEYQQTPYKQQLENLRKKLKMDVLVGADNQRAKPNQTAASQQANPSPGPTIGDNQPLVVAQQAGYLFNPQQLINANQNPSMATNNNYQPDNNNNQQQQQQTIYVQTSTGLVPMANGMSRLIAGNEFVPVNSQQQVHPYSSSTVAGQVIFSSPILSSDCQMQPQQFVHQFNASHDGLDQVALFGADDFQQHQQLNGHAQQFAGHPQQGSTNRTNHNNSTKPAIGERINCAN